MKKSEAIKSFKNYMRSHNIPYYSSIDNGNVQFTMKYEAECAPNRFVESCIWFYHTDNAEVRCYYNSNGAKFCRDSEYRAELMRLLNYINAEVFLSWRSPDGLYAPHMLYNPRIYLTEDDGYDITITTIVNYDFWELAPVETLDYITIYGAELLDRLAQPIFGVLLGCMTVDDAITFINNKILDRKELKKGKNLCKCLETTVSKAPLEIKSKDEPKGKEHEAITKDEAKEKRYDC